MSIEIDLIAALMQAIERKLSNDIKLTKDKDYLGFIISASHMVGEIQLLKVVLKGSELLTVRSAGKTDSIVLNRYDIADPNFLPQKFVQETCRTINQFVDLLTSLRKSMGKDKSEMNSKRWKAITSL